MSLRSTIKALACTAALVLASLQADAKTFRLNITADPAMMDPITFSELVSERILDNVYESFTTATADGKIVPMLAESWAPISDGKGFRFKLRKGVKFHSGRAFTAKDVKYTFEQLLTPGNKAGLLAQYLENVAGAAEMKDGKAKELSGVTIVDDHTIEVAFTKPDVLFPIYPFYFMDSGIVAEHGADWAAKVSAGTGPFKFKHWKRGVEVEIDAHPDYWGGKPKIDSARFLIIPSPDTALAQYDAGELDFLDVHESTFRRVLRDERYANQILKSPRAQARYMGMNQNLYEPFKDKRVREAISLSIDRNAIVKGLYDGAAFMLNGQVTPGVGGYDPTLPPLKFDPARAKQLLAQAGYPDGKGLPPIDIQCTPPFKDEITYYASQLGRVLGMQVNVKVVERATFIKSMNAGEVAFFPWGWTAGYPDGMYFLSQMWHSASPFNRARWKNPDFDKIIDEAQTTFDDAKRFDLYHKAERVLLDDFGTAPLPVALMIALKKPNVSNVGLTPFGYSSFDKIEIK